MVENPESQPATGKTGSGGQNSRSPGQSENHPGQADPQTNTSDGGDPDGQGGQTPTRNFFTRRTVNEWLTFGVATGTLLVAIGGLVVSYFTYLNAIDTRDLKTAVSNLSALAAQTQRQADAFSSQLELLKGEQRPWIGSPTITSDQSGKPIKVNFTLNFINSGKTPTTGIYIGATLGPLHSWDDLVREICERGRAREAAAITNFKQSTIIPGQPLIIGDTYGHEIELSHTIEYIEGIEQPQVIGCIIYGSPFDNILHQTQFVAAVEVLKGKIVQVSRPFPMKAD